MFVGGRDECWGPSGRQPWPQCVDDFTSHILCCTDCFNLPWWRRRLNSFCHWIITHTCWHTCECVYTHAHTHKLHMEVLHTLFILFHTTTCLWGHIAQIYDPGSDFNFSVYLQMDQQMTEPPNSDCCPSNTDAGPATACISTYYYLPLW